MPIYDCIVIGAGPAGSTAAYHLAKKGRSVLLLEKAALPRYKPCGGGVSPQVAQWFDFDFSPVISAQVTTMACTWRLQDEVITEFLPTQPLWMVRRDEFDFFLVQQAQRQGATLQQETKALGLELKEGCWSVSTTAGVFQGRYLIAADGARGTTAQWLKFPARVAVTGGALEVEPRLPVAQPDKAYLEFGLLSQGYVWNFPKADGYSIGAGIFYPRKSQGKDLLPALQNYAAHFGVDLPTTRSHGHPLLLWNGSQRLHTEQALLAGEAAAIIDPLTAEGIRPSIFSGMKAAEAIDASLGGQLSALENYTATLANELGSEMQWAKRLAYFLYRFPQLSYQIAIKNTKGRACLFKILFGEMRYGDIAEKALARLSPL